MKTLKIAQTANANLQNRINASVIFNYIREYGPTYRARISKDLNISAPAVSRIIEKLIEDGYVIETAKLKTNSGKRPIQIDINANKGIVLGIDLIKERVKIAVSDFSGKINLSCRGFEVSNKIDIKTQTIEEIKKILNEYYNKYGLDSIQKLKAIGIGIPATVDIETGEIINAPLFSGLRNINLKKAIEVFFNVPVYIENISKLSALAEYKHGVGRGLNDLVFIEISKGIGAGIILNGNLFRGISGSAGEIGFMITNVDGLNFTTNDEKGFLESKASTDAIVNEAKQAIKRGAPSNIQFYSKGNVDGIDLKAICSAYKDGDPLAVKILSRAINLISISIINLILVLNPELIIIGGEICNTEEAGQIIISEVKKKAEKLIPFKSPEIKLSKLGENAGVIGASFLAIESLLLHEFPYYMEYRSL